jgi:hypothetical protein
MAKQALRLAYGIGDWGIGPRIADVTLTPNRRAIRVQIGHAAGVLSPSSDVRGFAVETASGVPLGIIPGARVDGQMVVIELSEPVPARASLRYGVGAAAECNLTDSEDVALPVTGPTPLD